MEHVCSVGRRNGLKAIATVIALGASPPMARNVVASPFPEKTRRQLRQTLVLSNPYDRELVEQIVWMYLPVRLTATQFLEALSISSEHVLHSDPLGQTVAELRIHQMPPFGQKIVTISADLSLSTVPLKMPQGNVATWLDEERYIEINDPKVQLLAATLRKTSPSETVDAIYDWVSHRLERTAYSADDFGAAQALLQGAGDCTEFAYLSVALARVNRIPARMVGGYVADRSMLLRAEDYHNWAEVYIDGVWRVLDAHRQQRMPNPVDYVAFHYYRDKSVNPIGLAHRYQVVGDVRVRF